MITKQQVCAALLAMMATTMVNAAPMEPYRLYQEHCSKCHGESGAADSWRGYFFFARSFRTAEWQASRTDAEIIAKINKGPRNMPSYQESLSAEQKAALVRVIRSFGR